MRKPESFSLLEEPLFVGEDEQEELVENGGDDDEVSSSSSSSPSQYSPHIGNESLQGWPQSYRKSMDMYSHFGSPRINYSESPSFSQLGSYHLSSSQRRPAKSTERLSSLSNSFLPVTKDDEDTASYEHLQAQPQNLSYHKVAEYGHGLPGHCSTLQGTLNGINVLCGVGILTTPYALKEGGWLSLGLFLMLAIISFYTGILLRSCLDSQPGLETYPDIGQAAFGTYGRVTISIFLYMELYVTACVEFLILEGDNISAVFPNANLGLFGLHLTGTQLFIIMTAICVLPTVLLRDLSLLSYVSAVGVVASVVVVLCVLWVGVGGVGFQKTSPLLNLSTLPISVGLYGFCYSGHSVFPNIYSSLKNPSQFPKVLMIRMAVMGFTMFGDETESQITLNLPEQLVASKIAVWCTIINPFTKYPFTTKSWFFFCKVCLLFLG
ncbi:hypothetical protein GOP47_0015700 [Adiantum capillus-veneris]|uniref:Amino acid transporter transmembrane domain-containing protein n=1 Tax=Adiantum capillus-veneris TaxID=13818 RepID=A0A9D4ZBW1_ADICA|nr:hypothetical protein GOP47_0015700 [Adiantum capillus-veneris]